MREQQLLYHYTDYQALDGIVGKGQLRLNNLLNMNDAAEMRLFMEGLFTAVTDRLRKDGMHDALKAVKMLFHEESKKEFYYSAYAACFSKNRDDAAQWERYGNHGRGVCIAFSREVLQRMAAGTVSLTVMAPFGHRFSQLRHCTQAAGRCRSPHAPSPSLRLRAPVGQNTAHMRQALHAAPSMATVPMMRLRTVSSVGSPRRAR